MRIAVVHSRYSDENLSGENRTVDEQVELLTSGGHDVLVEVRRTRDAQHRRLYPVTAAVRVGTGLGGRPSDRVRAFAPDVVHVHNLFPNFGTAWLATWPGPVVATLHNFRYLCANGLLLRDGRPCVDCPTGSSWSAVRHACYRDSRMATVPLAIATRRHLATSPVIRRADRLVAVADHARDLFVRFGAPADRLDVVPHGIPARHRAVTAAPTRPRFLLVGRLSPEKGVRELVRRWPVDLALDIVGDGPQAAEIRASAGPGVTMLGARDDSWRDDAPGYTAVVVPGLAVEAAIPRTIIEAWEAGVPVVVNDAMGAATTVRAADAGVTYHDAASLRTALLAVEAAGSALRTNARAAYERTYRPSTWLPAIEATYAKAIARRR